MTRRGGRAALGTILGAGLGLAALHWATDGFRALTVDGARQAAVAQAPRTVPRTRLIDEASRAPVHFGRDTVMIVDFVSTSCATVCVAQGARFEALQDALRTKGPATGAPIRLLTISFDPDDDTRRLAAWRDTRGVDPRWWRVVRTDAAERQVLFDTFGITVVRDPLGGWRHNAAFHIVDARGRLTRIVPAGDVDDALRTADTIARAR